MENTNKKKKTNIPLIVILIIVYLIERALLIFIPLIIYYIFVSVSIFSPDEQNDLHSRDLIYTYKFIKNDLEAMKDNICYHDCEDYLDIDERKYDLDIEYMGGYYAVELEFEEDYYENFKLDDSLCNTLDNATCIGNKIIGKVYVESNYLENENEKYWETY